MKHSKSHTKWYRLHPNQDRLASSVTFWHCDSAKLNSAYSRIARSSGLTSPAPSSRTLSHACNQAAGLSRCLSKVQQGTQTQLLILQCEQAKAKSAGKVGTAIEELQYLMNFSTSITRCVAKAIEHLSDFTSMVNLIVCRMDSYLAHVKSGLKQDTLAALRQAPLDLPTLFPDSVLKRAEDDVGRFEDKGRSHGQAGGRRDNRQ